MQLGYLTRIGVPFEGQPVHLGLPEEAIGVAEMLSFSAEPKAKVAAAKGAMAPKAAVAPKAAAKAVPADSASSPADDSKGKNILETWIEADLAPGGRCHGKKVMTRFPPEPNGYLHIGHAKSILINFGLAQKFDGQCNLRFDDTNPETEEAEYVESIQEDVCWITSALKLEQCENGGKPWRDSLFFASDYFDQMYEFAIDLIKQGKAYVDSQSPEDVKENRGGVKENEEGVKQNLPGVDSPFRSRSVQENLKLFQEMQDGDHPEGSMLLRAKIDMNHPNFNLRDPPMYRIRFKDHHRAGSKWKVYPIYDFAHGNEDAIEGVTHSICTLEFENHNTLYRWFIDNCSIMPSRPVQKEFARLEVEGAVTSKRKLLRLVKEKKVTGWDDPRLMTVRGIRRRGVRPEGIKHFCDVIGVSDRHSVHPLALVEACWREDLEPISLRRQVVSNPLLVEIYSYGDTTETIDGLTDLPNQDIAADPSCARSITFSSNVFIDRSDFMENAPETYFRLSKIGSEVKLRYAYCIKLEEVIKDESGNVAKLRCSHDPATRDVMPADRKLKVIHWVNSQDCVDAEVRLINQLFLSMPSSSSMPPGKDFMDYLNPEAWVLCNAKAEPSLTNCKQEDRFQFERVGFFAPDYDTFKEPKRLIFNRVVALKKTSAEQEIEGKVSASRNDAQMDQAAKKERWSKIPPEEFFKLERGEEFSKYDERGMPTHDKNGKELTKNAKKKLEKDLEKHTKVYKNAQA
jgi:glutaminyl-tRNA synthetase